MRRSALLSIPITVAATLGFVAFGSAPLAGTEERWAAFAPNLENSAQVVWGATQDEAKEKAASACRASSATCAAKPANTNGLGHVFALMCCSAPERGCAATVGETRQIALHEVKRLFADAGYSQCRLQGYFSAATGQKG
ncbi:hypothetical protein [Hyphomicrobium sp. D-2]|uniref:hypothetical protein n=1 Tax=Hyphomicrobium sp. D-2 TaxID=3041621 RepID=UPI002456377B|nr:hypothetical protein [Hyphomicrobium sp. D-2]MDH4983149.1 hypothetical protein [Hyphomicrobium sp. D-2]